MKKRNILTLVFLFVLIPLALALEIITGDIITGEVITGDATSQPTNVSITVVPGVPSLTLLRPENRTYLTNNSLLLNFTVSGEQAVWFNLDDGANTTVTGASYFNASYGGHRLYLFANASNGTLAGRNVNFTIAQGFFNISYSEFNGTNRGNSTDFYHFSFEELQNLSDIILENVNFAKMKFNFGINCSSIAGGLLDLDSYTNISFNRIELNSSALQNFNGSAILVLYNLTFTNPRIVFDGVECPASICQRNYYTNGELSFNVSHFTVFGAEETPAGGGGSSGSSGSSSGGGGGTISETAVFDITPDALAFDMILGARESEEIKIKNRGSSEIEVDIEVEGIEDFVELSDSNLFLGGGDEAALNLTIEALERGTHTGKIIFKSGDFEREALVLINVKSEKRFFDVSLSLAEQGRILRGEMLEAFFSLIPIGEQAGANVTINYVIKDFEGEALYEESEEIFVFEQISFVKEFDTSELREGDYVLGVEAVYQEGFASAGQKFTIFEIREALNFKFIFAVSFILIIVILIIILLMVRFVKKRVG